jgi:hypothetical protein
MNEHSDGLAVFMTDLQVKFTLPDGYIPLVLANSSNVLERERVG